MNEDNKSIPPKITVYIVNHNYGRYLEQAIESVLAQTMQDCEILIIDDGSTDDSRSIIESYQGRERIYAVFQQNKGLNVTNNIALRMAQGEYIMRLDADDYLDPNALTVLAGVLDREPNVGLVFPDYYQVDEAGNMLQLVRRHNFEEVDLLDQPAHGACTMIRRELLRELGGYDESFRRQDGYELWIRFVRRYEVKNINLPLFYYRQHGSSLTRDETELFGTRNQILRKHALALGRDKKALAVIAVRGSQADPHSFALRTLGAQKVIDWTIETALEAELLRDIIVTTPDQAVLAHVARRWGDSVIPLYRDPRLAQINSFVDDTIVHALEHYAVEHDQPDAIAVLPFEAPFRRAEQIDSAIDVLEIFETDRVISVREEPGVLYQHRGNGMELLRNTRDLWLEADYVYRDAGVVSVVRTPFFKETGQLHGGRIGHVMVDRESALTLDSEWSWRIARLIAEDAGSGEETERMELNAAVVEAKSLKSQGA